MKADLYQHLIADTTLTAAVGDDEYGDPKIYAVAAPQGTSLPHVIYQRITATHTHHMGGSSGLANPLFQITVYASDAVTAATIGERLREALDAYTGGMGGTDVQACFLQGERDEYTPPVDDSETGVYSIQMDFMIWHGETIPLH